jgi:ubiquinol-cytochrome c reductase cytochrome c1 subunit
MRTPRSLFAPVRAMYAPLRAVRSVGLAAALAFTGLLAFPVAAQDTTPPPNENWSFDGIFGTPDIAAAQRGFQVYSEVCSTCHAMHQMHFRDLVGLGFNAEQVKAIASTFTVPQGTDDSGQPKEGPGTPANQFRSPFANEKAARAAMNGAYPPDLSLIINAREGGANYVYGILTGYAQAPAGFTMQDGMNYNRYFPGHQIAMPQPLQDGRVTFTDGTPNTIDQMARDVVTFLYWTSNPETTERKQMGIRVILFLILLTGVTYAVKRKIWADVH